MMKRKSAWVLSSVVLLLFALIIWGPKLYLKVLEKQIDNVNITQTGIRNQELRMNIKVDVSSRWVPILMDSIAYRTEIYDTVVSEGTKRFPPGTRKNASLIFPVVIHNDLLKKNIKNHQGERTDVKMYIRHYLDLPLIGKRTIDVLKHVHMKLPVIPEARILDLKIEKIGLNDMQMYVTLALYNPNNIDFTVKEMKYQTQIRNYATAYGKLEKVYHIKKMDTTVISLPVSTDLHHELKALWKTITGDTEWPYYMRSQTVLKPSDSRISDIYLESEKRGTIDVVKAIKVAKNKERVGVDEHK